MGWGNKGGGEGVFRRKTPGDGTMVIGTKYQTKPNRDIV